MAKEINRHVEMLGRLNDRLKDLKDERDLREKIMTLKDLIREEEEKIKDLNPGLLRKVFKKRDDF
jgi:DNA-binding transcriptional regulator GbsR (MarR family)